MATKAQKGWKEKKIKTQCKIDTNPHMRLDGAGRAYVYDIDKVQVYARPHILRY